MNIGYKEPKLLLHFQWQDNSKVYRYALVEIINEGVINHRTKQKDDEVGLTLLRIIEVIGQDNLEDLDEDTLYFIISALNQLDIDYIRNKILLKVLPLKV